MRVKRMIKINECVNVAMFIFLVGVIILSWVAFGIHTMNNEKRYLARQEKFEMDMKEIVYGAGDIVRKLSNVVADRSWVASQTLRHEQLMVFYEENKITESKKERLDRYAVRLRNWEHRLQALEKSLKKRSGKPHP